MKLSTAIKLTIFIIIILVLFFVDANCQDSTKFDTLKFKNDFQEMYKPKVETQRLEVAGLILGGITTAYLLKEDPYLGFTFGVATVGFYDIYLKRKLRKK